MNFIEKLLDKLYYKQWSIGIGTLSPEEFIRDKKSDFDIQWLDLGKEMRFLADPFFAAVSADGTITILAEDFRPEFDYGLLSQIRIQQDFKNPEIKVILDTGTHLSYPFLIEDGEQTYMIPESGASGKVPCYLYDMEKRETQFVQNLLDQPYIDPTIIRKDGKYWLFATKAAPFANSQLCLFYADNLLGPYNEHPGNPIVTGLKGSRPAGNIFEVDGNLYRPAQDCSRYYGGAMVIKKIGCLNEREYSETDYMEVLPKKDSNYDFGIHTINFSNGYVLVDGLRRILAPIEKSMHVVTKRFK